MSYYLGLLASIMLLIHIPLAYSQQSLPDAGITPDSPFYTVKRLIEEIDLIITFEKNEKMKKHLKYAELRLSEAKTMAQKGKPDFVKDLSNDYDHHVAAANKLASSDKNLQEMITDSIKGHVILMRESLQQVPEKAEDAIRDIIEGLEKK